MRALSAAAYSACGWLTEMALSSMNFSESRISRYFTQDKSCTGMFCGGGNQT